MTRLIIPPESLVPDRPVIFLAGPIQGAADWQAEAAKLLEPADVIVANPRRPRGPKGSFNEALYREQVDWEHLWLGHAAKNGCILFWHAKEQDHDCGRAYAQTTRFELAWTMMRRIHENARMAVGIEEGYTGAKYIRHAFSKLVPDLTVASSLEDVCKESVRLALS